MTTSSKKSGADDLAELAKLFADPARVEIAGETVEVRPLTIRQTGRVAAILRTVFGGSDGKRDPRDLDVAELVADHTEAMVDLVAVATGRPVDWVGGLRADHFVELAVVVFRVNGSFFVQCVAPRLAAVPALLAALTGGDGPTSSPTSPPVATATPAT